LAFERFTTNDVSPTLLTMPVMVAVVGFGAGLAFDEAVD
jgi:hypothetical protein